MSETVHTETIESLAGKLATFAEGLPEDERRALDLFFLASGPEVEGFGAFNQMSPMSYLDVRSSYQERLGFMLQRMSQTSSDITQNMT